MVITLPTRSLDLKASAKETSHVSQMHPPKSYLQERSWNNEPTTAPLDNYFS